MPRQQFGATLIISSALFASRNAGNRWRIVEEADTFAVLSLMIFHHETKSRIEPVDRQRLSVTTPIWIAGEKLKTVLPDGLLPENYVTEIQHVMLVANCDLGRAFFSL